MSLPTSGAAWSSVVSWAAKARRRDLSNQNDPSNTVVLAKALVYARTGDAGRRAEVVAALSQVRGTEAGARALALGRELAAYVLAADLIGYRDPSFMSWAASMRTYPTTGGPPNLIACHEERPNNWGTHCGASRIAIDLYIGDSGRPRPGLGGLPRLGRRPIVVCRVQLRGPELAIDGRRTGRSEPSRGDPRWTQRRRCPARRSAPKWRVQLAAGLRELCLGGASGGLAPGRAADARRAIRRGPRARPPFDGR